MGDMSSRETGTDHDIRNFFRFEDEFDSTLVPTRQRGFQSLAGPTVLQYQPAQIGQTSEDHH